MSLRARSDSRLFAARKATDNFIESFTVSLRDEFLYIRGLLPLEDTQYKPNNWCGEYNDIGTLIIK